jgi:hypothetical protein
MKKIMFTGVLALFIGGVAQANTITNDKIGEEKIGADQEVFSENLESTSTATVISGPLVDEGGTYYIISDSNSCRKVYVECSMPLSD